MRNKKQTDTHEYADLMKKYKDTVLIKSFKDQPNMWKKCYKFGSEYEIFDCG